MRNHLSRREALLLGGAAGLGLTAGGLLVPQAHAQDAQPKRGGRMRVAGADSSTADTLDPARGSNDTDYCRLFMFYNGLTVFDEHLNPQPDLATSLETKDAKVWTIKLRKGVTFHDGSAFTADDVVYTLNRHKDPKTGSVVRPLASALQEVKATAPDEVQITLSSPNAELPTIFAVYQFVIVKNGTTDFSKGNGTGPFICKEFSPGIRSVGVRNPNYFHEGRPYLDQIVFTGITDDAARVNALLSGDLDLTEIDVRSAAQVKAASGFEIFETKSGDYTDLIMHLDAPQIGNPDFVMAMKYLQNRQQILNSVLLGYGSIGNDHPIAPSSPYYDSSIPVREFDPDKAKSLLQKAGMLDKSVQLVCSPAATGSPDMAVILQNAAQGIGFNLQVRRVPSDGFWSNFWLKAPFTYGNINPRPNPDILFSLFFQSSAPWNESRWKSEKFDKLLLDARAETDFAKRKATYGDMQRLVRDEAGIGIPAFISSLDAHTSKVKGLRPIATAGLMGDNFAQYVWLDS
jgi:peptide/nickel transport system substrate-binding protein